MNKKILSFALALSLIGSSFGDVESPSQDVAAIAQQPSAELVQFKDFFEATCHAAYPPMGLEKKLLLTAAVATSIATGAWMCNSISKHILRNKSQLLKSIPFLKSIPYNFLGASFGAIMGLSLCAFGVLLHAQYTVRNIIEQIATHYEDQPETVPAELAEILMPAIETYRTDKKLSYTTTLTLLIALQNELRKYFIIEPS